eukprot:SAG31_NODE_21276_length_553_cov_1.132159_1_plen_67_part_10
MFEMLGRSSAADSGFTQRLRREARRGGGKVVLQAAMCLDVQRKFHPIVWRGAVAMSEMPKAWGDTCP